MLFSLFTILLTLAACQPTQNIDIQKLASSYYQQYQLRNDFQKFLAYYDQNVILLDMISGDRIVGIAQLEEFLDWENPNFKKLETKTLIIEEQIIEGQTVVTSGYFTPFEWGAYKFPSMYFTFILTFNDQGKIVKQRDWINYPNELLNYAKRKNSNDWIKEY